MSDAVARVLAFYLPQYHPIPENDAWWGKGFTEWTNVTKARPLFQGHCQPRLPADLGFYDLRVPEVREAQAELARNHGVEGFCYWHYWFGNGKRLLQRPFEEVLQSGRPDFPFCLAWANESWSGVWHGACNRILMEQTYPGEVDQAEHFRCVLRAFRDRRYLRVNGKPLFIVYRPTLLPEPRAFAERWRRWAEAAGLKGLFLAGVGHEKWKPAAAGFDARIPAEPGCMIRRIPWSLLDRLSWRLFRKRFAPLLAALRSRPTIYRYETLVAHGLPQELPPETIPSVVPNWDNTPRCGERGAVFVGATPERFGKMLRQALRSIASRPFEERLLVIKSWNEWAEGNYLEPDQESGCRRLEILRGCVVG